jgi:NADPH-dependent glutamate synthase beta subunit-like oxidoreductase/ferredoxin
MATSLTDAQLRAELARCLSCEAKPCRAGCPAGLSPADFILAARGGQPSDYRRAAAHVLAHNPLGETCGQACPETLCMARCTRRALDAPVEIPAIQAAIVRRARELGALPHFRPSPPTGQRVAVVGAGPAGLGAATVLAKAGHAVDLFDRATRAGGMARLVPRHRLDPRALEGDLAWLVGLGDLRLRLGEPVALPRDLLARGYAAVIVTTGLGEPVELEVPGEDRALHWTALLGERPPDLRGRRVAVVGDGGVAIDCALAATGQGAAHVEIFARKALSELGLARRERDRLLVSGVHLSMRVRVTAILGRGRRVSGLALRRLELPAGQVFHPSRLADVRGGDQERRGFDAVVLALGGRAGLRREPHPRIHYAGDLDSGPGTVVEALASGKRAGLEVHRLLAGSDAACPDRASCADGSGCPKRATCPEWNRPAATPGAPAAARPATGLPVPLETEILGRAVASPFLLAAPPFTGRYDQVRRAYEAGWAGAVMHPAPGADAARLAADVERLRREFPDRLTVTLAEAELPGRDGDGPDDALSAARLLARGARAILVDGPVRRHGLGIVGDLHAGLSWLLAERRLASVAALAGSDLAQPARPPPGSVAAVEALLCTACGSCARCPELAITLDGRGIPAVDRDRCTGCANCVDWCATGAIAMRAPPAPPSRA